MKRGEIWRVNLNPTIGSEQEGERPVLIVSADDFNHAARLAVICPITGGGGGARARGFTVPLSTAGTKTTGVILVHQVRVVDLIARKARRVEKIPKYIVDEVLAKLETILT